MALVFKYEHCLRCDCPLTPIQTDKRHRKLCIRCHKAIAANSVKNPNACTCGVVSTCERCNKREYAFMHRERYRETYRRSWWEHYYRNWEKRLVDTRRWRKERKERALLLEASRDK